MSCFKWKIGMEFVHKCIRTFVSFLLLQNLVGFFFNIIWINVTSRYFWCYFQKHFPIFVIDDHEGVFKLITMLFLNRSKRIQYSRAYKRNRGENYDFSILKQFALKYQVPNLFRYYFQKCFVIDDECFNLFQH